MSCGRIFLSPGFLPAVLLHPRFKVVVMLRRLTFPAYLFASLAALGTLSSAAVRAQSFEDGLPGIDKKYREVGGLFRSILKNETPFENSSQEHKKAVEFGAKSILYRIYYTPFEPKKIDGIVAEHESTITVILRSKSDSAPQLAKTYAEQILAAAPQVLATAREKKKPIAALNVARILAETARLGQGELADLLVALVRGKDPSDPKKDFPVNDGVRYWALRGLRDLLALPNPPAPQPPVLTKEREETIALAILEFLDRKVNLLPGASRQEIEGYRLLRREAVRALARSRFPAVGDKGRPALALLKFVAADARVSPPPRLDERLEGAIGIARMQSALAKDYQPDYAAFWIGEFIVDFAKEAAENSKVKAPERLRPWKVDAARLKDALEAMKADTKNKYVADMVTRATPILTDIENGKQPTPANLASWLGDPATPANPPPSKELFKDTPDSAVKLGPALETKPEKSGKPEK